MNPAAARNEALPDLVPSPAHSLGRYALLTFSAL